MTGGSLIDEHKYGQPILSYGGRDITFSYSGQLAFTKLLLSGLQKLAVVRLRMSFAG